MHGTTEGEDVFLSQYLPEILLKIVPLHHLVQKNAVDVLKTAFLAQLDQVAGAPCVDLAAVRTAPCFQRIQCFRQRDGIAYSTVADAGEFVDLALNHAVVLGPHKNAEAVQRVKRIVHPHCADLDHLVLEFLSAYQPRIRGVHFQINEDAHFQYPFLFRAVFG